MRWQQMKKKTRLLLKKVKIFSFQKGYIAHFAKNVPNGENASETKFIEYINANN